MPIRSTQALWECRETKTEKLLNTTPNVVYSVKCAKRRICPSLKYDASRVP